MVAPDPEDVLHELMDDLGEVHDVDFFIGLCSVHCTVVLSSLYCISIH